MTANTPAPALSVRGAVKRFGTFTALNGADLDVEAGSIHALLGHNGAGKSTLISLIAGASTPTAGTIRLGGVAQAFSRPADAAGAGISVIYQHLSLVDSLTVSDNIFLGDEQTRGGALLRARQREQSRALLRRVGAACSPDDVVATLPIGQRQLVEVAKALHRRAAVLVLDEPTAALSDTEAVRLGELILQLRDEGLAIIYVTHLLAEVERLADEVTVLRDGEVSFRGAARDLTRRQLVELISGSVSERAVAEPAERPTGPEVLRAVELTGHGFGPIDLTVEAGEIVALFGMLGSGRGELLETLAGARRAASGELRLSGHPYRPRSPQAATRAGVTLVADDRARNGLLPSLDVRENTLVSALSRLSRYGMRDRRRETESLTRARTSFAVIGANGTAITSLSGGNQQKVMLARATIASAAPKLLLLDGPTQGVDVGARSDIYASLRALVREHGTAILFSTTDPEEARDLADRVVIVRGGRIVAERRAAHTTDPELIHLASHGTDDTDDPQGVSRDH